MRYLRVSPLLFLFLLTIGLAVEAGYYDGKELNFECYHGSIEKCDALRLLYRYSPGFLGIIFSGLVLLAWIVLGDRIPGYAMNIAGATPLLLGEKDAREDENRPGDAPGSLAAQTVSGRAIHPVMDEGSRKIARRDFSI